MKMWGANMRSRGCRHKEEMMQAHGKMRCSVSKAEMRGDLHREPGISTCTCTHVVW